MELFLLLFLVGDSPLCLQVMIVNYHSSLLVIDKTWLFLDEKKIIIVDFCLRGESHVFIVDVHVGTISIGGVTSVAVESILLQSYLLVVLVIEHVQGLSGTFVIHQLSSCLHLESVGT